VLTEDGYYRFVNHTERLLTTGFITKRALLKYKNDIRGDEMAIKEMAERYNAKINEMEADRKINIVC
jgi:hypothetical protein